MAIAAAIAIGAVAGLGVGAAAYALSRPSYGYPAACPYYAPCYLPIFFPRHVFFTWA